MKNLFLSPKKAIVLVICTAVAIAAISVTAVKSTLITKAEAKTVALKDAGLSEADASALRARLEFDDGRFQYEVDFYSNGTEYEYLIQAKDGDIIARDIEGGAYDGNYRQNLPQEPGNQTAASQDSSAQPKKDAESLAAASQDSSVQPKKDAESLAAAGQGSSVQPKKDAESQAAAGQGSSVQPQGNSLDTAKAAALRDAGLAESDVTFKKAELDHDSGMQVYDIEFYTSDAEYDYKINASDGTVLEKSIEQFQVQANPADSSANSPGNNYIGADRAKEIALTHAGLSESDVQSAKTTLEYDDGKAEYEIEFYFGRTEYDYTIDAVTGNIMEYDVDHN